MIRASVTTTAFQETSANDPAVSATGTSRERRRSLTNQCCRNQAVAAESACWLPIRCDWGLGNRLHDHCDGSAQGGYSQVKY
jgi:hypothetical protein